MLYGADWISRKYGLEVAKLPPPPNTPQAQACLDTAHVWFSVDLNEIQPNAFETLNNESLWDCLREVGVQGVYLKGLKKGGAFRTGLGLDPKWGSDWDELACLLSKKGIALIGEAMGRSTGLSADFWLALKKFGDFAGLYHLVEVEKRDWKWLPRVGPNQFAENVPWLNLQELHKKGYVPEEFAPYVKESSWNATPQVKCDDGKVRRWIYLKEGVSDPVIDWLNPSFAGFRIATADLIDSLYNLGEKIVRIDASLTGNAKETLSLWSRKLGGFSVQEGRGCFDELKAVCSDLMEDTVTRAALLHAMIAQDAGALKLIYRFFLDEGIAAKRLVHVLQPFDQFTCDWAELLEHPRRKYHYYDEILTGEVLRERLLKKDLSCSTWPGYCAAALNVKDFEKHREEIGDLHLLLAFFYAMQPGAFSFSVSDLLGTLSDEKVDPMDPCLNTLYASLPGQLKNPKSFAMQLRKILRIRRENGFESAELVGVPDTMQPGLMLLMHKLKGSGMLQLLAVNFGRVTADQVIEMPCFRNTTAIDLMSGLAEKKPLESATLRIQIPALTGKVILFQTKYYD